MNSSEHYNQGDPTRCDCGHEGLTPDMMAWFPWLTVHELAAAAMRRWNAKSLLTHLNPKTRGGACIQWALATCEALRTVAGSATRCFPISLVAGSAYYLRVPPNFDDGKAHTHFSFVFEDTLESIMASVAKFAMGELPELHAWIEVPFQGIGNGALMLDFSAGDIPEVCERLIGAKWLAERPPCPLIHIIKHKDMLQPRKHVGGLYEYHFHPAATEMVHHASRSVRDDIQEAMQAQLETN